MLRSPASGVRPCPTQVACAWCRFAPTPRRHAALCRGRDEVHRLEFALL